MKALKHFFHHFVSKIRWCPRCGGTGKFDSGDTCYYCNGSGIIDE